jgi:histone-lysine N-methyltransferase SETMAR
VQKSAGKFLASIFWDQDDILLIDYLPKGQRINAEYYLSLLVQLNENLKEKHRGKFTKGVLFLHDNVPVHRALATQKKLAYLGFQWLDNPPYSPVLALSEYHLFPGLKKKLKVGHFFQMRKSLRPQRLGWTDNFLNFCFEWLAKFRATGSELY